MYDRYCEIVYAGGVGILFVACVIQYLENRGVDMVAKMIMIGAMLS